MFQGIFDLLDADDSGALSREEFVFGLGKLDLEPRVLLNAEDYDEMTAGYQSQDGGLGPRGFEQMLRSQLRNYLSTKLALASSGAGGYLGLVFLALNQIMVSVGSPYCSEEGRCSSSRPGSPATASMSWGASTRGHGFKGGQGAARGESAGLGLEDDANTCRDTSVNGQHVAGSCRTVNGHQACCFGGKPTRDPGVAPEVMEKLEKLEDDVQSLVRQNLEMLAMMREREQEDKEERKRERWIEGERHREREMICEMQEMVRRHERLFEGIHVSHQQLHTHITHPGSLSNDSDAKKRAMKRETGAGYPQSNGRDASTGFVGVDETCAATHDPHNVDSPEVLGGRDVGRSAEGKGHGISGKGREISVFPLSQFGAKRAYLC